MSRRVYIDGVTIWSCSYAWYGIGIGIIIFLRRGFGALKTGVFGDTSASGVKRLVLSHSLTGSR